MKTCYIIILSFLFASTSVAQNKFFSIHGGPKAGLNILLPEYNLWFTDKVEYHPSSGYAGAFVEFGLGKHLAVQAEGLAEQFTFTWYYNPYTIKERASYISIPVIVKFKLRGFSFYGGYQWGIFNFAERKMNGNDPGRGAAWPYDDHWHSANSMYANNIKSVLLGIEYTTSFGLGFTMRYVKGLTDMTMSGLTSVFIEDDHIYNTYVSAGIQWSFGPKRK